MSKEKVAYVIINPEGKKLWPMLRYREKDCIKFFLSAAMSVTKKARNWKYWRDKKGYQVKPQYLSDKPEGVPMYNAFPGCGD